MTTRSWMQRTGATPAKLALVGVLGTVFVAVVWGQLSGRAPRSAPSTQVSKKDSSTSQADSKQKTKASKAEDADAKVLSAAAPVWRELPLEEVVRNDPMRPPHWYLAATRTRAEVREAKSLSESLVQIEKLKEMGARIVVIAGDQKVATIGQSDVRVGDVLEGFRVMEISTDGIVVTEIGPR